MKIAVPSCLARAVAIFAALATSLAFAQPPEKLDPPPEDPNFPVRKQATPEEAVRIYEKRLEAVPKDNSARIKLGRAYLRWARESGNEEHYDTAEAEFQKVLKADPKNASAKAFLASAWMAQHKFQEALKLSQEVFSQNANNLFALATIGDAQLELGQYDEAEASYQKLAKRAPVPVPEIQARLARIAEFRGKPDEAIKLLEEALAEVEAGAPNSSERAWYQVRLGELYFATNRLDDASRSLEAALKIKPKSVPALLALGQVRAGQGQYGEAAGLYEQVVEQQPDFDLIGDLATLQGLAGNEGKAKELEDKAISLIPVAQKIETEARHLALFLADREIQLDLAVESARKELKVREDVFAYDVLAWALFKAGQKEAAWEAMQTALRLGTKDARMHYHAGMIAKGLGQTKLAIEHLSKALEINPHFGFTEPEEVRKALKQLEAKS